MVDGFVGSDGYVNPRLLINRVACAIKLFGLFARTAQGAIFVGRRDSLPAQVKRSIEPHTHATVLVDQATIGVGNPGAAAECDHTWRSAFAELLQDRCFDGAIHLADLRRAAVAAEISECIQKATRKVTVAAPLIKVRGFQTSQ